MRDALTRHRSITACHEGTKGSKFTKFFDQKDFVFFVPSSLRDESWAEQL